MLVGEFVEEGETDEAVAVMVAMDEGLAMEARTIVIAAMEGEVMEGGLDATVAEGAHEAGAELKTGADKIIHVAVVGGVVGNIGELDTVGFYLATKDAIVNLPNADTALLDIVELFELRPKEGGIELGGEEGGTDVAPAVLIDHAAIELGAVGAFLPDDLGAAHEAFVVDDEHASLAAVDILSLMEGEGSEMADGAEGAVAVVGVDAMGGIFDHEEVVLTGEFHNAVHITGHAGIMDHDDDAGARGDERSDGIGGDIGIERSAIGKDHVGPFAEEGDGGRDEGIGGHDDFIAGMELTEHGAHLEGISAGGAEEALAEAVALFEEGMAALGEVAVA